MAPKVFIVGGTGAQRTPVIKGLVQDGAYSARVLTSDLNSVRARGLAQLGDVELVEGPFASGSDLGKGLQGCDCAFVNIDGFNAGAKSEIFWAIRAYEIAIEEGIKLFIYGNSPPRLQDEQSQSNLSE
ncbi:hypothetical protein AC578_1565 [Pseudocercospora eumusae]|uniref:NmrA-like domain-containing protein n=1 Tax=Pseudocercospora eumusae TaxID=321146 RepID=A0A139HM62_9PEZI|nr:hypothetical protein AC578_1565 [Pseudocercospora eumusae]